MFRVIRDRVRRSQTKAEDAGKALHVAREVRKTQERKRDQEQESVILRIDRIYRDNDIAARIARRLAGGGN